MTTTPEQTKALTPMQSLAKALDSDQMKAALEASVSGTGRSADRFRRLALIAVQNATDARTGKNSLLEADRGSLFLAIQQVASTGLELDPSLGHAALVARGGKVTVAVMMKGLIALGMQSPKIGAISSGYIHEADQVLVRQGSSPSLEITTDPLKPRGPILAAYCVTHWADGTKTFDIMSKADGDAYRAKVKAGPLWGSMFWEMVLKTCVRKQAKMWPITIPSVDRDEEDDPNDDVIERSPAPMKDITPPATARDMSALAGEM